MDRNLLRSLALFVGIVAIGSVLPDVFRFIEGKEYLGHSFIIPVAILGCLAFAYCGRLTSKFLLRRPDDEAM